MIRNVVGNNTISGQILTDTGPAGTGDDVRISSDAGLLTLSGGILHDGMSNGGTRAGTTNLILQGASNGAVTTTAIAESLVDLHWNLRKEGAGTWSLQTANTYTGTTTVAAGTLAITDAAAIPSTSPTIVVQANATLDVSAVSFSMTGTQTLKGNGAVVGSVTTASTATVAPGESIGTLTVSGNATLGGTLDAEYDGSSSAADLLAVSGALDVSSATLSLTNLGAPSPVGTYVLATYGTLAGTFPTVTGLPAGYNIDYHYAGANSGNSIALVVPEPATLVLVSARRYRPDDVHPPETLVKSPFWQSEQPAPY